MTTLADAGAGHRGAALRYLRNGRVVVTHVEVTRPGAMPSEATVRVMPAMEGQPDRTVLLRRDVTWSCSCGSVSTAASPGCGHAYAAMLVTGRGGPR